MSASAQASQTGRVEVLDVRGMPAPSNVLSVLKRASALPAGVVLELRSDTNPWQLYDLLQQRGFVLQLDRQKDGSYSGLVRPRQLDSSKH